MAPLPPNSTIPTEQSTRAVNGRCKPFLTAQGSNRLMSDESSRSRSKRLAARAKYAAAVAPGGSQHVALARMLLALRLGAGIVFVAFGVAKFTNHASELASFRQYGLPTPDVFVYAIGVVEIVAGAALVSRRITRLAALVLAGDMAGAIVVSGIGRGEDISLTLAPVLLLAMIALTLFGPGGRARDRDARQLGSRAGR
jgi:uncharacterized membrane protein YphA (DoxX/SURF4 family)